jgi:murein DD-endopeptidase MepM/ murein hydrolase activator NlpD
VYAFYEHLRAGSVRVHAGDRVHKGEVIGALGFSGDSTGPHLHLHVADCGDPLRCEGVPFVIDMMQVLGRYDDLGGLGTKPWRSEQRAVESEWPGSNVVVRFR